jgi:hypothetical protein
MKKPSSGMLRHVALVRIDVSEERSASIFLTGATQRNMPEDGILQSVCNFYVTIFSCILVMRGICT